MAQEMSTHQPPGDQIQCPQISSTTDIYSDPFRSKFRIGGRPTYRSPPRRPEHPSETSPSVLQGDSMSTRRALVLLGVIFALSVASLVVIYRSFPTFTEDEWQHVTLPFSFEEAKHLGLVLNRYKDDNYFKVMAAVFATYIFLQTYAIPGSLFLSLLSGFLFPFPVALVLVCTCSALGATFCFLWSKIFGRKLVQRFCPVRAAVWIAEVKKHRENFFNYMLFLRITPFLPNWLINLCAPVAGIPLVPFALGTFLGVAPPSFLVIQAGQTLQNMTADDDPFGNGAFYWLAVFGVVPLLPIIFKEWFKKKIE